MDLSKVPSWLFSIALLFLVSFVIFLYWSDTHFEIGGESIGFKKVAEYTPTQLPIGSIIALHSQNGDLPSGWVECNGQKLVDVNSTLNDTVIPNLNGSDGDGRYLRGTTGTTGVLQNPTKHPYVWATGNSKVGEPSSHNLYYPSVKQSVEDADYVYHTPKAYRDWKVSTVTGRTITGGDDPAKGHDEQYFYSRPSSMTVRWIMRVK